MKIVQCGTNFLGNVCGLIIQRRLTIQTKAMEHTFKVGITLESVDKIITTGIKCFLKAKFGKIFHFRFHS